MKELFWMGGNYLLPSRLGAGGRLGARIHECIIEAVHHLFNMFVILIKIIASKAKLWLDFNWTLRLGERRARLINLRNDKHVIDEAEYGWVEGDVDELVMVIALWKITWVHQLGAINRFNTLIYLSIQEPIHFDCKYQWVLFLNILWAGASRFIKCHSCASMLLRPASTGIRELVIKVVSPTDTPEEGYQSDKWHRTNEDNEANVDYPEDATPSMVLLLFLLDLLCAHHVSATDQSLLLAILLLVALWSCIARWARS